MLRLKVAYDGSPDWGQVPKVFWQDALRDGALVKLEVSFSAAEVEEAIYWARKQNLSFERDGELGDLLAAFATIMAEDVHDVELLEPELEPEDELDDD